MASYLLSFVVLAVIFGLLVHLGALGVRRDPRVGRGGGRAATLALVLRRGSEVRHLKRSYENLFVSLFIVRTLPAWPIRTGGTCRV